MYRQFKNDPNKFKDSLSRPHSFLQLFALTTESSKTVVLQSEKNDEVIEIQTLLSHSDSSD